MTLPEYSPVSYLRAIREVIPSQDLRQFLGSAALESKKCFGTSFRQIRVPQTLEERTEHDYKVMEGVEEPEALIFRVDKLWVTQFERRAVASDDLNDAIGDAYARMNKAKIPGGRSRRAPSGRVLPGLRPNPLPAKLDQVQEEEGLPAGNLLVPATAVIRTNQQEISGLSFYALQVDPDSREAKVLRRQTKEITKDIRIAPAAKALMRGGFDFETPPDPTHIPFMISTEAADEKHDRFLDAMNTHLMDTHDGGNGIVVELARTRWQPGTKSPAA